MTTTRSEGSVIPPCNVLLSALLKTKGTCTKSTLSKRCYVIVPWWFKYVPMSELYIETVYMLYIHTCEIALDRTEYVHDNHSINYFAN